MIVFFKSSIFFVNLAIWAIYVFSFKKAPFIFKLITLCFLTREVVTPLVSESLHSMIRGVKSLMFDQKSQSRLCCLIGESSFLFDIKKKFNPFLSTWRIQAFTLWSGKSHLHTLIKPVSLHYMTGGAAFAFKLDKSCFVIL